MNNSQTIKLIKTFPNGFSFKRLYLLLESPLAVICGIVYLFILLINRL